MEVFVINQFRAQQLMHDEMHSKGKVLARSFRPIVHFVIPATEIESMHYYTFISDLLADFALFCDERNVNESRMMRIRSCDRPNEEGGHWMYIRGRLLYFPLQDVFLRW